MISDDKATNTILKGLYVPASKMIDCPALTSSCRDGMEEWRTTVKNDNVNWYVYRKNDCAENRSESRNDCYRKGTLGLLRKADEGYAVDIPDTTQNISIVHFITSDGNGIDSDFSAKFRAQN